MDHSYAYIKRGLLFLMHCALLITGSIIGRANEIKGEAPPVNVSLGELIVLTFRREPADESVHGDFNPYDLVALIKISEVVVHGQVVERDDQTVQFEIIDILKGEIDPDNLLLDGNPYPACGCVPSSIHWEPEEVCLLFLEEYQGGYRVVYNDAGKWALPVQGVYTVEDMRLLLQGALLPEERALEITREFGPSTIIDQRPHHEEIWQEAILHFYQNREKSSPLPYALFQPLTRYLLPETAKRDSSLVDYLNQSYNALDPSLKIYFQNWIEQVNGSD